MRYQVDPKKQTEHPQAGGRPAGHNDHTGHNAEQAGYRTLRQKLGTAEMKHILATLFLSAFFVASASAQFLGPSRYSGVTTVEEAQSARRGQNVMLDGFVIEHLRANYYIFRDATGEMRVKIDRHRWRNRRLTSKTPIRLTGRLDREVHEYYVNVHRVEILE